MAAETKEKEIVTELKPYQILVDLHFESLPIFTEKFQSEIREELKNLLSRDFGPSWNLRFSTDPLIPISQLKDLENLSATTLGENESVLKEDKVFFLLIQSTGASYSVYGREWDTATREIGYLQSRNCYLREEIPYSTTELIHQIFEPILAIDRVDSNGAFLRARAGELVPQNYILAGESSEENSPSFLAPFQIQNGSILVAYYRYFDKDKTIRKIDPVTWTYLSVTDVKRASVEADIISGLRSPLSTRMLRRVELIAKLKRPQLPNSTITFYPFDNRTLPFAGMKVRLERKLNRLEESKSPLEFLWTDRDGQITIPKSKPDESPIVWIFALSGESLVSRVPYVPGLEEQVILDIPDDTIRLSVEGELALLESDLITSVTKRTILFGRVKKLLLENKWPQIEEIFKELDALEGPQIYNSQLSAIRVNATEKAKARNDKYGVRRITELCQNMQKLINRYIDPKKIRDFQTEVRSLKDSNEKDVKDWLEEQNEQEKQENKPNATPEPKSEGKT